ncbi:MAG: hypothetical protein F6J90_00645 [Moorea sp. SIOASIH]|nr:hypothetical protein [Moorena sp. SIOASIH]
MEIAYGRKHSAVSGQRSASNQPMQAYGHAARTGEFKIERLIRIESLGKSPSKHMLIVDS